MIADPSHTRLTLTTATNPGAVAVLQLTGPGTRQVLEQLTGRCDREAGRLYLADLAGVDRGMAVLLRSGTDGAAQLMPHGGPRVVRSLIDAITALGVVIDIQPDPVAVYPEADSPIQADALAAVAKAASPGAIDLLLAQPTLWRSVMQQVQHLDKQKIQHDSRWLDRLTTPPTVVVVGKPNVGKSTLTNRLMGRSVSLVADLPGTTRDWVGAVVEIFNEGWGVADGGWEDTGQVSNATPVSHPKSPIRNPPSPIAVRWIDTPGLRASEDDIEQRAIGLATQTIESADVLIVMRDPRQGWPTQEDLPREPDIKVMNKADLSDKDWPGAIPISAATGQGIDTLQRRVIEVLGLNHLGADRLWAFSDTLRRFVRGEIHDLSGYLG